MLSPWPACIVWTSQGSAEEAPWWYGHRRTGRVISSATTELPRLIFSATQTQIQDFYLAYSNIYLTYESREHVKVQVLQIQSCRKSMTQDIQQHDRAERSVLGKNPILMADNIAKAKDLEWDQWLTAVSFYK